jgi:hypothetical protein
MFFTLQEVYRTPRLVIWSVDALLPMLPPSEITLTVHGDIIILVASVSSATKKHRDITGPDTTEECG